MRTRKPVGVAKRRDVDFAQLLHDAVTKPGVISAAYSRFWRYSPSNQLLALFECLTRGLEPGPLHTFKGWLALDRHVRKGEKAIELCMPVSWTEAANPKKELKLEEKPDDQQAIIRRQFIFRRHWFVLCQTDGAPYMPISVPEWNEATALYAMHIDRVPFHHSDGNCQGYARRREVAVSPVAALPHRTLFHEIAHVVLGHTEELLGLIDREESTPRDIREVEAEAVSYICCQSLSFPGESESRGYLQHWLGRQKIDERNARRIFHAADTILRAGRPDSEVASDHPRI